MFGNEVVDDVAVECIDAVADAAFVGYGLPHAAVVGDADEHRREDVAYRNFVECPRSD